MNLISVKYQDNYIYIYLKISKELNDLSQNVQNIYVEYRIKVFNQVVKETCLIKKQDIIYLRKLLILILKVDRIKFPKDSQLLLDSLKLSFHHRKKRTIEIRKNYSFPEIETSEYLEFTEECLNQTVKKLRKNLPKTLEIKKINPKFNETNDLKAFDIKALLSKMMKSAEQIIESQLDNELKQLEMDIKQVCTDALDLLISNLPLPQNKEELRFNNVLINSIRKYMQEEIIHATGGET